MPSSNMADGGLVGYATGDETKYRGKINQLVGAKLGPTNPKTLDESMSDLQRFRKSQQIGRLINDHLTILLIKFLDTYLTHNKYLIIYLAEEIILNQM